MASNALHRPTGIKEEEARTSPFVDPVDPGW